MRIRAAVFILVVFVAYNRSSYIDAETEANTNIDTMSLDPTLFRGKLNLAGIEIFLKPYLDSLEIVDDALQLPSFLYDPQFDYEYPGIWQTLHNPISIRVQLISRVNKCRVLNFIVGSKNIFVHKVLALENNILVPKANMSFSDLARRRMEF